MKHRLTRYRDSYSIRSGLDPLGDVLVLLEYLTVHDYVIATLSSRHGMSKQDAAQRAKDLSTFVKAGISFIEQSLYASPQLAFLPAYYGVLNLMKAYVLVGPHYSEIPKQRHHGATYDVYAKDSHSILTERIKLKESGVIPLFYRTVTGQKLPLQQLSIGKVLAFVTGVTAEYELAAGEHASIRPLALNQIKAKDQDKLVCTAEVVRLPGDNVIHRPKDFRLLKGFRVSGDRPDKFIGRAAAVAPGGEEYRSQFRTLLIYHTENPNLVWTPLSSGQLLFFEELPIALLLFYLGSVVRYKPEFMVRIRDSKFWPMLAAARRHSLFRFLVLCWSFIHNQNLHISHALD